MRHLSKEQLASLLTAARAHSERDWFLPDKYIASD
jgi:hypothetical protein